MHADVARQSFETFGEFKQLADLFLLRFALIDERLDFARINRLIVVAVGPPAQGYVAARLKRNELGQLIAKVVAEIEHATDVTHDRFGRHRAKRYDLRNAV